jgi:hypothetical protein
LTWSGGIHIALINMSPAVVDHETGSGQPQHRSDFIDALRHEIELASVGRLDMILACVRLSITYSIPVPNPFGRSYLYLSCFFFREEERGEVKSEFTKRY